MTAEPQTVIQRPSLVCKYQMHLNDMSLKEPERLQTVRWLMLTHLIFSESTF